MIYKKDEWICGTKKYSRMISTWMGGAKPLRNVKMVVRIGQALTVIPWIQWNFESRRSYIDEVRDESSAILRNFVDGVKQKGGSVI